MPDAVSERVSAVVRPEVLELVKQRARESYAAASAGAR